MKMTRYIFLFSVMMLICCIPALVIASQFSVEDSFDRNEMKVSFINDTDVNCVAFTITPVPDMIEPMILVKKIDLNKENGKAIIYGYERNMPIPSGDILILRFGESVIGNTKVIIVPFSASNSLAEESAVEGGEGILTLKFLSEDITALAQNIIGLQAPAGMAIDINKDGVLDCRDIIAILNKGIDDE